MEIVHGIHADEKRRKEESRSQLKIDKTTDRISPFDDTNNQKRSGQKPKDSAGERASKSTLCEPDNSLNGTEFEAARDPAHAIDQVRLVVRGCFDPTLIDERSHEAVEAEEEDDRLVGGQERKGEAGEERPEGLRVVVGEPDSDDGGGVADDRTWQNQRNSV